MENIGCNTLERYQQILNDRQTAIMFKDYYYVFQSYGPDIDFKPFEEIHYNDNSSVDSNNKEKKLKMNNKDSNHASATLMKQYKITESIDIGNNFIYNNIIIDFQNEYRCEIDEDEEIDY